MKHGVHHFRGGSIGRSECPIYIVLMAAATEPIDLFDPTTWGDHDLEGFQYLFAGQVCIHATHQQLSESYVRAISLAALTGVGEERRGNRIASTSGILRYFTEWVEELEPDVKRLQGAKKAQYLLTYITEVFQPAADRAVELLGGEKKLQEVKKYLKNAEKQSDVEHEEGLEVFKKGVESDYTVPQKEISGGVDLTARAGGRVILTLLSMKNDTIPTPEPGQEKETEGIVTKAVHAELRARNIPEHKWSNLTPKGRVTVLKQKIDLIRAHEFKELRATKDIKNEEQVSDVAPKSDLLKAFLDERQDQLLEASGK